MSDPVDLSPELEQSIDELETRHNKLLTAVDNYTGNAIGFKDEITEAKDNVLESIDTKESVLLGLVLDQFSEVNYVYILDFKENVYLIGDSRVSKGATKDEVLVTQEAVQTPRIKSDLSCYEPSGGEFVVRGIYKEGDVMLYSGDAPLLIANEDGEVEHSLGYINNSFNLDISVGENTKSLAYAKGSVWDVGRNLFELLDISLQEWPHAV